MNHNLVENKQLGVNFLDNGDIEFALWAPFAKAVSLEIRNPNDIVYFNTPFLKDEWVKQWHIEALSDEKSYIIPMQQNANNIFTITVPSKFVKNGDMYRYILTKVQNNKEIAIYRKDPRSEAQPHIFSWSKIYDQNSFNWSPNEKDWLEGKNPNRVGVHNKNLLSLNKFAYLEIHIPTATKEGNLAGLKKHIDRIANQGFSGLLLMPAEGTYDVNWGYDGVDKFAITRAWAKNFLEKNVADIDKVNDALKEFVDYCHQKNLNVGIDWVPSHITEEYGNVLQDFAPYENVNIKENEIAKQWGGFTFNLEGLKTDDNKPLLPISEDVKQVRKYICDIPLKLVKNYHFDFIRGDQSPNMYSNITMKLVKAHFINKFPDVPIIWEDHRTHDKLTEPFSKEEFDLLTSNKSQIILDEIENNNTDLNTIGGDEIWDFNFSHTLEANILNKEVWPAYPSVEALAKYMDTDYKGTKYLLSHDEIGNHNGSRIMIKYLVTALNLEHFVKHNRYKSINAANAARKILDSVLYQNSIDLSNQNDLNDLLEYYLIPANSVDYLNVHKVVQEAFNYHKIGHSCVYLAKGSKMIFQGDNYGEINPFYFHRIQPIEEVKISCSKGYDIGEIGYIQSKNNPTKHFNTHIFNMFKDLNKILKDGAFLETVKTNIKYSNNEQKCLVLERIKNSGLNEKRTLFFINFSKNNVTINTDVLSSNKSEFVNIFDSNYAQYGGSITNIDHLIISQGKVEKSLAPISFSMYSQL